MAYSQAVIQESEALWAHYFEPALGKRAANQFRRAMQRPDDAFADHFLNPHLFRPDLGGGVYVPVDITKFSDGRNHLLAETISTRTPNIGVDGDPRTGLSYFANPLRIGVQLSDPFVEGRWVWEAPSHRVILAPIQIFTFEFDQPSVAFLGEQLAWMRSTKNLLDCPMGALYRHCSSYADFAGITANYSGNKGIHVHIAFRTNLAVAAFPRLGGSGVDIRAGLIEHWSRLHPEVLRVLGVPEGITADPAVRYPEQFRRFPNGLRELEKPSLLGVPAGEFVPQVTLWERWTVPSMPRSRPCSRPTRCQKSVCISERVFFPPSHFLAFNLSPSRGTT